MGARERALSVGVLLAQVGTPEAPTPRAVRRYLGRFLSDRRVVDYPAWLWQPLLRGVILPLRSRRSARLYQRIWTSEGSPLLVESEKQRARLSERLGSEYHVRLGMAYAGPSFDAAIADLISIGVSEIRVLPMFPQYSSATTASVYDASMRGNRPRWPGVMSRPCVLSPVFREPDLHRGSLRAIRAGAFRGRSPRSRRALVSWTAGTLRGQRRSLPRPRASHRRGARGRPCTGARPTTRSRFNHDSDPRSGSDPQRLTS